MSNDQPDAQTFADLGLAGPVLSAVADVGYEAPSPIQAATIPPLLAGRDVVGLAQTGTGKTAAFALPILSRLDLTQKSPQALVLAPTRELALQVCEAFEKYAAELAGRQGAARSTAARGTASSCPRCAAASTSSSARPAGSWTTSRRAPSTSTELRFLVLDEADEMLNMGFAEDVETILADTPDDKQVALFSATMPAQIRRLSTKYLHDPVEITVKGKTQTAANITQRYLFVSYPQKVDALTRILEVENFEGMIVFVRTKNETETLAEKLRARGFSATAINGDVPQNVRERTVNQLKSGRARHPGRHRRRRARAGRRAGQPRRQLRHPDRHRVLRAPHRAHRPGRPQRRRDLVRDPARALPAQAHREGHRAAAGPDAACPASRTSTPPGWPASTTPSPRPSSATERVELLPRRRRPLRARARRARGRRRRRAGRRRARATSRCCSTPRPSGPPSRRGERPDRRATAAATAAPGWRATAARSRRTGSPSASGTRSSRARSSAPSPTRAG